MNASLQAHRTETTLTEDGTLLLDHLPCRVGESVEVIVLAHSSSRSSSDRYALRATVLEYLDPFESAVAEGD